MENIQVAVRVRPLNGNEVSEGEIIPWRIKQNTIEITKFDNENQVSFKKPSKQSFAFDHCFAENQTNEQVYTKVAKSVVTSCLEGYNGTIFMYGQTGSGKTYTMLGYNQHNGLYSSVAANDQSMAETDNQIDNLGIDDFEQKCPDYIYDHSKQGFEHNTGILIQSLRDIFDKIENDTERTFFLKCSYFEIYNDQIYDLLGSRGKIGEALQLQEDVKNDNFVIKGLTCEAVSSVRQIFDKLKRGEVNRHYAETFMNHSSSRSHCIFRLTVKAMTNTFIKEHRQKHGGSNINLHKLADSTHEGTIVTESYLNFIDLAGSERMSAHIRNPEEMYEEEEDTKVVNHRIKEGKHINKSLFFLTQVISLKAEGKSNQYIPFRNSPLTKILRSSLGGNFRTAVVCCINPCLSQADHSLSTLRFGSNAKKIQNRVRANVVTNNDSEAIRLLIDNYERKIRDMQHQQDDDITKYQQYISIIDDLKIQRSALLERLEAANRRFATKLNEDIGEDDIEMFFAQFKQDIPFNKNIGLMFTSRDLEAQYREAIEADISPHQKQSKAERLKRKFNDEFGSRSPTLTGILDTVTLRKFEVMKTELSQVKESVQAQRESIVSFCNSYKTLCQFMETVTGLGQKYLTKLREIIDEYQDEYLLSRERLIKLQLYEEHKGLSLMSEKDLQTMEDYVRDFMDALKSEKDRRELLESKDKDLPNAVFEGLDGLKIIEEEEQAASLEFTKQKIADFVKFNEGCTNEIEYYRSLCNDFNEQQKVEIRQKDIEKIINEDMILMTLKIKEMDDNFRILDRDIEENKKNALNKQLKDYKTKFEKLVDVVLTEKKKREEASPTVNLQQSGLAGDLMVCNIDKFPLVADKKLLKRSNSITITEEAASPNSRKGSQGPARSQLNNRVKGWLTLNALENTPMNYESVLREETLSMTYLRSPLMKKDQELNGSFSDLKSHNELQNYMCSEFSSPLNHGRLDGSQKKNLQQTFDLTFVGRQQPKRLVEERSSYRSNAENKRIQDKRQADNLLLDSKTKSRVNFDNSTIFKTTGAPVVINKEKKASQSRRKLESHSFKDDQGSITAFKRSLSNMGKNDMVNLFGSSTDLKLQSVDDDPKNQDVESRYVPFSNTLSILKTVDAMDTISSLKQRHQSQVVVSQVLESNTQPVLSENHSWGTNKKSSSRDKHSPWQTTHHSKTTTLASSKVEIVREDPTRAPSANRIKFEQVTSKSNTGKDQTKGPSKMTPTMLTKGLLLDNYSKPSDSSQFDFSRRPQSRQRVQASSPGKPRPLGLANTSNSRPRQASKDQKSVKGKIDSLVSTAKSGGGYRVASVSKKP